MNTPYHRSVVWDDPDDARSGPRTLDRDQIVAAALRLADEGGLEAVSMRKIAAALGVGPMRTYTHVPTKADLLDLMVESVYGEIAAGAQRRTPRDGDWRHQLHQLALSFRDAAFRHDWFVDLLSGRPHLGPHALTVLEETAAALGAGARLATTETTRYALGAVNAYMIGATRADVMERRLSDADGMDQFAWEANARDHLRAALDDSRFPTLTQLAFNQPASDPDKEFAWGLDAILDGIANRDTV